MSRTTKLSKNLAILALVVLTMALPARAQKETPPIGGDPKPFNLPETTVVTLDNGLVATLVPYGSLPKVTVRVVVRFGNVNETADQVWLADLTGTLMAEGTTSMSSEELKAHVASMGGELDVRTGLDTTTVTSDVLSEFGPELVATLADVVRNPALPESEIERLKADLARSLSISLTQPQPLANQKFYAELYGDHPYGRLYPTQEQLAGYAIDDVRSIYAANFGALRARVYVAGRFDPQAMEEAIREAFGDWEAGPETQVSIPEMTASREIHLVDRPGAPQSTLRIGLPTIDPSQPDHTALEVANSLLGGSFGSRITSNIREDKGYTYSPSSNVADRYRSGHWVQSADVTTEATGASLKEIFFEIDRLQAEPPPADELEGIQNYMAGIFVLQNSSRGGIIGQLAYLDLHGLGDDYLTGYVDRVYAVTPEEVSRITRDYIDDESMTIVVVGDRSQVTPQLAEYGEVN